MKLISKKYFVALIVALATGSAWGKQAIRIPLAVTQPDGSELTIVKRGNAAFKSVYTLDGYLLKYDDKLGYVYAVPQPDGSIESSGIVARNAEMRSASDNMFLENISKEETAKAIEAMSLRAAESGRFQLQQAMKDQT